MYRITQGTPANKVAKRFQINRRQLSWIWARIVRKTSVDIAVTNQQSFFSKNRLQNSRFFFSKSVKNSAKRGVRVLSARSARASHARKACETRDKNLSPHSRSLFSASFQTFCLTARAYLKTQKYGLFCSLLEKWNRINWYGWPNKLTAGLNGFRSLIFDWNNFLQREPKRQLYFVIASLTRVQRLRWKEETCYGTDRWWYKAALEILCNRSCWYFGML